MTIYRRIIRVFEKSQNQELTNQDRFGAVGETKIQQLLQHQSTQFWLKNPIVPRTHDSYKNPADFSETDYVVYTRGTVFCIEVKNLRGYIVRSNDDNKIIQVKSHGIQKEIRNPARQVRSYLHLLKNYLAAKDGRFGKLFIVPVAVFWEGADITEIHNFEQGLIYASELERFFDQHANPNLHFANRPIEWIMQGLQSLYSWDEVNTTQNERFYGILSGRHLEFKDTKGHICQLEYRQLDSIVVTRAAFFSAYDKLVVTFKDGSSKVFKSTNGEIKICRPGGSGETQSHKLRNVRIITLGVSSEIW